jgi:hypothetical protein
MASHERSALENKGAVLEDAPWADPNPGCAGEWPPRAVVNSALPSPRRLTAVKCHPVTELQAWVGEDYGLSRAAAVLP